MTHLNKITISNARRFGKDVEIDLSSGANIFLAPNGTGKTTIFEAIEFALTGSIQRLANPPLSLIRDKQKGVDVRLDFDNGLFCEVSYRKGENPELSGDHHLLFPKHTIQDIPFLLRLTHLLEQSGHNWFIQKSESSQAGDLLDKLSIGKDLSVISKTKTTTLNAATRTITDKKEKREAQSLAVSSFEKKLKERDAEKLNYTLKPLNEISKEIQTIHKLFNEATDITNDEKKLNVIVEYKGLVNAVIVKSDEENQQAFLKISKVESQIPLFQSNKKEINEKQKQVLEKTEAAKKATSDLNASKEDLLKLQERLNSAKDLQLGLQQSKQLSDKKNQEEMRLMTIENHLKFPSDLILVQKEKLRQENELVEKLNADIAKFNLIRQREAEVIQKQAYNRLLQSIIDDWNKYLVRITESNAIVNLVIPQRVQSQNTIRGFEVELATAEGQLKESQTKLSSLKSASEAILSAVGIIAANLPVDQNTCPVCNTSYDPQILRAKIASALQDIDPVLNKEIEINRSYQQAVDRKKLEIHDAKSELEKIDSLLSEHYGIIKNMQALINDKCLSMFPDKKNIKEAEKWLNSEKQESEANLQRVIADRLELGIEPSTEELHNQIFSRDQTITEIQSLETNINMLTVSLENSKSEILKINNELSTKDVEQLDERIIVSEKAIENTSNEMANKARVQEQTRQFKKEIDDQILDLNMSVSKLQGQQNEISTQWKDAGMLNDPSVEELSYRKDILIRQAASIKKSLEQLDKISEELNIWLAAEKFELLDSEIKTICGDHDEQTYLGRLKDQERLIDQELAFIMERKSALDLLYSRINRELEGVHQQIKTINPLWVSLLKKIVVNPRFVDTHLDSYLYRNRPQAEVKIDLHETQVSVMDIASEAQATDLQLTFMLSMASSYKWTPWKSLLLDDPTQHHDLVHASGVFDLLRDYIIDHDFQILMGTHDSVQGKYFQRKLRNENVDVKLWRLLATDDGVTAELIS